jgi:hypothetical protein
MYTNDVVTFGPTVTDAERWTNNTASPHDTPSEYHNTLANFHLKSTILVAVYHRELRRHRIGFVLHT